jgi:hypothetical protein
MAPKKAPPTIRIGISMPPICPNFSYVALKFYLALMFFLGLRYDIYLPKSTIA